MRTHDADTLRSAPLRAVPLAAVLALAACGGGGGGGNGGDGGSGDGNGGGGDGGGDNLTELDTLSGVPDNDNWLFYTSNAEGNAGLFGFNPLTSDGAEEIDADAYRNNNPYLFTAISSGNISGTEISDYRAEYIFYRSRFETASVDDTTLYEPESFQRVSAVQRSSPGAPVPEPVSNEFYSGNEANNLIFTSAIFQNDLDSPDNTAFAYRGGDSWWQIRTGDDASTAPDEFDSNHQVVVSLGDGAPNGWLAIDGSNDNNRLVMMDMDRTVHDPVPDQNDDPVDGLADVEMFTNLGLDAQLVALTFEDQDSSDEEAPEPELWLYTHGQPGTIKPLLNGAGEKLTFSRGLTGGASLPPAEKLVVRDNAVYFAQPAEVALLGANGPELYRVDENGWSVEVSHDSDSDSLAELVSASPFLIEAGDRLIWRIGSEMKAVDPADDFSESVLYNADSEASTTIPDSEGGWFYYNDDGTAVAAKTDGSERIQLHDATWVGASSQGEGSVLGRLAKSDISEVFLLHDDGTLVAVSASNPDAGGVVLGQLDPAPEGVNMFGIRPGQHQLMQVHYTGDTDSYEVVYVDSREPGSLQHLMAEPTADGARPVYGN